MSKLQKDTAAGIPSKAALRAAVVCLFVFLCSLPEISGDKGWYLPPYRCVLKLCCKCICLLINKQISLPTTKSATTMSLRLEKNSKDMEGHGTETPALSYSTIPYYYLLVSSGFNSTSHFVVKPPERRHVLCPPVPRAKPHVASIGVLRTTDIDRDDSTAVGIRTFSNAPIHDVAKPRALL